MLKKPLFVSIFVLLFFGLSDYGYAVHKTSHNPGGPGGGRGDEEAIPLCMTLAEDTDIQRIGGNGGVQTFCDGQDPAHVHISISRKNGGNFAGWMSPGATPLIQLDFTDCTSGNCGALDFEDVVTGVDDPINRGLANVTFLSGSDDGGLHFDFESLVPDDIGEEGDPSGATFVDLVVGFGFYGDGAGTTRGINYGLDVTSLNVADSPQTCFSNKVTVKRVTPGCWEVSSDFSAVGQACLFKESGHGKNASILLQGKYDMPFMMTLQAFSRTFDPNTGAPLGDDGKPLPHVGSCLE